VSAVGADRCLSTFVGRGGARPLRIDRLECRCFALFVGGVCVAADLRVGRGGVGGVRALVGRDGARPLRVGRWVYGRFYDVRRPGLRSGRPLCRPWGHRTVTRLIGRVYVAADLCVGRGAWEAYVPSSAGTEPGRCGSTDWIVGVLRYSSAGFT